MVSWCYHQQSISVCSKITSSALCVSAYFTFLASPQLQFFTVVNFLRRYRGLFLARLPLFCRLFSSQVVCSSGHADDVPVVDNNRCLELDSVVLRVSAVAVLWWSVPSPSLQVQVPMVLTVQMNNVAVLGQVVLARRCTTPGAVYVIVLFHLLLETHDGASPALLAMDVLGFFVLVCFSFFLVGCYLRVRWSPGVTRPFLVLQYIIECIIWFRAFFAQHRDSRHFGLLCRYCHMLMVASRVHSCGLRLSRA